MSDWTMAGRWAINAWRVSRHDGTLRQALGFDEQRVRGIDGGTGDEPDWDWLDTAPALGDLLVAERFVSAAGVEVDGVTLDGDYGLFRRERIVRTWTECDKCEGVGTSVKTAVGFRWVEERTHG